MTIGEDKYYIAFASIEEIGAGFIKKLVDIKGSVKSAWEAQEKDFFNSGLRKSQVETFLKVRDKIDPDKMLNLTEQKGINWLTYSDKNYPELLKQIENPPMTLFYKGDLGKVNFERTISVVGSRRASSSGKENLSRIIKDFCGTDLTIISGGAVGIDACAHKSAVKNGLSTIAVIGSGLDKPYPSQNKELFDEIIKNNGLIMSEYWHDFDALPFRFPVRNRIVSGLSKGTLVAEAALKSGAMITANLCLDQGRELMCMPGDINNVNTQGIYHLIKNGASLVTNGQDIMDVLGWELKCALPENSIGKNFAAENSGENNIESDILSEISVEPLSLDMLASRLNYSVSDLMTTLTTMELSGLIKQMDGARYISCG